MRWFIFFCKLTWDTECPGIWHYSRYVRVFLGEINIWIWRLSNRLPQCVEGFTRTKSSTRTGSLPDSLELGQRSRPAFGPRLELTLLSFLLLRPLYCRPITYNKSFFSFYINDRWINLPIEIAQSTDRPTYLVIVLFLCRTLAKPVD